MIKPLLKRVLRGAAFVAILLGCSLNLSKAQTWTSLAQGSTLSSAPTYSTITTLTESSVVVPYVGWIEAGAAKVRKYTGGTWQVIGTNNVADASATYFNLFASPNGKLYATYIDGSASGASKLAVKVFNTATSAWEPLNNDSNNLYVSPGSATHGISAYASVARAKIAFTSSSELYIAYSDNADNMKPVVKRYDTGTNTWLLVGEANVSSNIGQCVDIAFDSNNNLYASYLQLATTTATTGTLKLFKLVSNSWTDISPVSPIAPGSSSNGNVTAIRNPRLTIDGSNNPTLLYFNTSASNSAFISYYQVSNNTWYYSGKVDDATTSASRDAQYYNIVKSPVSPYLYVFMYDQANGSNRLARVYRGAPPISSGTAWSWKELRDPSYVSGATTTAGAAITGAIDNPTSFNSLAIGSNGKPYISYATVVIATPTTGTALNVRQFDPLAPSALTYTPASSTVNAGTAGSSATPTISGYGEMTYSLTGTVPSGVSINSTRGIISFSNTVQADVYNISVLATSTEGSTTASYSLNVNGTLPVNLTGLKGTASVNSIAIEWKTLLEENSNKFTVEKSLDGVAFTKLTEVKSKGASSYAVVDYSPVSGTNYYRLIQEDNNGVTKIYGPIAVSFSLNTTALSVYPNPSSGSIFFKSGSLSGNVSVALADIQGRIVHSETITVNAGSEYQLNLKQGLTAGQYVLILCGNAGKLTSKVLVK